MRRREKVSAEIRARNTAYHQDEPWEAPIQNTRRRGPTIALLLVWGSYALYLQHADSISSVSLLLSVPLVAFTAGYAWFTRRSR